MATIPVTIQVTSGPGGPAISVHPDPVRISVNDEIDWNPAPNDFVVFFDKKKPFKHRAFFHGKSKSGRPTVNANPNKPYKYTVVVGELEVDPGVIVY